MDVKIFSLEEQKRKIHDQRSKKYFDEVYKSYANSCYRSATVMLWSVVICDLIFKLQELRDFYNDQSAGKILTEIEAIQAQDPYSPKWEKELLKLIFERTKLLDTASHHKLSIIQDHRHLSAHPVISDEDTLFEPTDEMVRSDIRNAIESLLAKPPFLTQKVLSTILSDLENVKDILPNDASLEKYLNSKYLHSINQEVIIKIFRGFWKFAFRSEEELAKSNREINYRSLRIIYNKQRIAIQEQIKGDNKYYSNISSDKSSLEFLIDFLSTEKLIYDALDDSAKEIIKPFIKNNLSFYAISFFVSETPEKHIENLTSHIREHLFKLYGKNNQFVAFTQTSKLKKICNELGVYDKYRKFGMACYICSTDFERADLYYERYIKPELKDYTADDFIYLLEGINTNNQVYWRNRSSVDDFIILKLARDKLPSGYDFSIYNNLPVNKLTQHEEEIEDTTDIDEN